MENGTLNGHATVEELEQELQEAIEQRDWIQGLVQTHDSPTLFCVQAVDVGIKIGRLKEAIYCARLEQDHYDWAVRIS